MAGTGPPGLVSGLFNKTFKVVEKPASIDKAAMGNDGKVMAGEQRKMEERRGVME
jgi:hypothetical protein